MQLSRRLRVATQLRRTRFRLGKPRVRRSRREHVAGVGACREISTLQAPPASLTSLLSCKVSYLRLG